MILCEIGAGLRDGFTYNEAILYGHLSLVALIVSGFVCVLQGVGLFLFCRLKKEHFISKEEYLYEQSQKKEETLKAKREKKIMQLTAKLEELKGKDDE